MGKCVVACREKECSYSTEEAYRHQGKSSSSELGEKEERTGLNIELCTVGWAGG